jgi:integrase
VGHDRKQPRDRGHTTGLTRTTVSAPAVTDVQRLIEAADQSSPILSLRIVLAAVTGERRGEPCALRWSDINWERGLLTVARSLNETDGLATEGMPEHQGTFLRLGRSLSYVLN